MMKSRNFLSRKVLSESERAFNQMVLYGKDADFQAVVDNARRYPMMAQHQLVILKEAQEMRSIGNLISYVENPTPTTILVICHKHKRFNMNTKFGKMLKAKAVVFQSKPLYDNQVPELDFQVFKEEEIASTAGGGGNC